jgi:hypothetical protein
MKPWAIAIILCFGGHGLGFGGSPARGDGGTVRLRERRGPYEITVFTSPTPLRAGPVDFSVLVQDADSGEPVPDARVKLVLTARDRPRGALHLNASPEMATNKLLQAAVFALPEPGWWDVTASVAGREGQGEQPVRFAFEAAEPLPPWRTEWPWLAWPAVVVVLFGVHRWLVRRSIDSARTTCDNGPVPRREAGPGGL